MAKGKFFLTILLMAGANIQAMNQQSGVWDGDLYDKTCDPQYCAAMRILDMVDFSTSNCIADFGCGSGKIVASLAQKYPDKQFLAYDKSASMICKAQETYGNYKNIKFVVGDIQSDAVFQPADIIYSFATLHWISDKKSFFEAAAKNLTSQGKLIVRSAATVDQHPLLRTFERLKANPKFATLLSKVDPREQYFPYSMQEAEKYLKEVHLEQESIVIDKEPILFENEQKLQEWFNGWFGGFPIISGMPLEQRQQFLGVLVCHYVQILKEDDVLGDQKNKSIKENGTIAHCWPQIVVKAKKS